MPSKGFWQILTEFLVVWPTQLLLRSWMMLNAFCKTSFLPRTPRPLKMGSQSYRSPNNGVNSHCFTHNMCKHASHLERLIIIMLVVCI